MYFSFGLGGTVATSPGVFWLVALLAPIPLLWLAYGEQKAHEQKDWVVFAAALLAGLIGSANLVPVYAGMLPWGVLLMAVVAPAVALAVSVWASRLVARRVAPISGVIAFAALWTGFDYLLSLTGSGAVSSPAYSQMELPAMIQTASLGGIWAITAVMGLFAAATAMAIARRDRRFTILAAAILVLNIGYGQYRLSAAEKTPLVRAGLAADDTLIVKGMKDDEAAALAVVKAYAKAGQVFAQQNANLIVFPERLAVLRPAWRNAVKAEFITLAHISHATVVAGFDAPALKRNQALMFFANGTEPQSYDKRKLVPGVEDRFQPGDKSYMLIDGTGVAICKDMDFPPLLRNDATLGPNLYAVPAWDFGGDGAWHARLAIMRGVENGFAVVRAARDGLLTVSDAYGRVVAVKQSKGDGMTMLRADVHRGPGRTLYAQVGDAVGELALALGAILLMVGFFAKTDSPKGSRS